MKKTSPSPQNPRPGAGGAATPKDIGDASLASARARPNMGTAEESVGDVGIDSHKGAVPRKTGKDKPL